MLRRKKDSLKDIPKDARHSLQLLDKLLDDFDDEIEKSSVQSLRYGKKVPADVRKSLEILDNVIGKYDVQDEFPMHKSAEDLRISDDVSHDVKKSLEALDRVLDEFQNEGGQETFNCKRVDKSDSLRKSRHDDIRRSLEVLDSVLAEFDDCLESWDTIACDTSLTYDQPEILDGTNSELQLNGKISSTIFHYEIEKTDGSTSHDSGLSLQEQAKVVSPPPIPKRSATTRLSDRNSGVFTFPLVNSQSSDSLYSDSAIQGNDDSALSRNGAISTLSAKDEDDVFKQKDNNGEINCCVKCGCEIDSLVKRKIMEDKEKDISSSPFSERRKMFEDKIEDSKVNLSSSLGRPFNASSLKIKNDTAKDSQSEPSSLTYNKSLKSERNGSSHSCNITKYSPKATKVTPPKIDRLLSLPNNFYHAPNCNCKERIRQLQIKFAETHRLLKANKINGLKNKPPSFVPPPPPSIMVAKNIQNDSQNSMKEQSHILPEHPSKFKDSISSNGSTNSDSFFTEENSCDFHSSGDFGTKSTQKATNCDEQKICRRCSKFERLQLSETIEDLPKLLPTDALNRPHLGLSYSMEDDLSPGVKEILQTSLPRNGLPLSRASKTTSLSTFSLSDTSLGYVSSQSDLELSNSSLKTDKVPVSTIKFSTLPEGMDLHSLPSYYGQDENKSNQVMYRDRNFNHTTDPQLRSSSAPPLPETEKPKKKHFRGFSRKEKKDKKKNDDNVSLVSHLSLDDEVILKAIDGDTKYDAVDSGESGVAKKRWSALRNILSKR